MNDFFEEDQPTEKVQKAFWDGMLGAWIKEPETYPERENTAWGEPGWLAWNEHAVEVQVADFLQKLSAAVVKENPEALTFETGTGQGFVTRRLVGTVTNFESDLDWRVALRDRELVKCLSGNPTLDPADYLDGDLFIFDSNDPYRMGEVCLWAAMGKPGSIMFVHDVGNGHPSWDGHYTLGQMIRTLKLPGMWLENPRGAFIGVQDSESVPEWIHDLWVEHLPHNLNLSVK